MVSAHRERIRVDSAPAGYGSMTQMGPSERAKHLLTLQTDCDELSLIRGNIQGLNVKLMDKSFIIFLAIPVFFLLMIVELTYGILTGKNNYRLNDTITSINTGLISRFPTLLNLGFQGMVFSYAATSLNLGLLPESSPLTWIFAFILYDLCYYWMHRLHHEYKLLWATHVVHHHGEEFNLSTAMRQTSTGFLWKWIFFLPMLMAGVPAKVFVAVGGLNLVYQFWVHTVHIGKLGWYEKYFITPSNHRIHHAKNPEYIDANYGGVFIIWDRIFGTYIEEKDDLKPVYGTVKALRSWNPLWANVEVFFSMLRDSYHTAKWSDKLRVWIAPTRWRPEDVAERFPSNPEHIGFTEKYDPQAPGPYRAYTWIQAVCNPVIAILVFFSIPQQTFTETAIFGSLLLAGSAVMSFILAGKPGGLITDALKSLFAISVCALGAMNVDLWATQALLLQSAINLLVVPVVLIISHRTGNGSSTAPVHYVGDG